MKHLYARQLGYPAGDIYLTAEDMGHYLIAQLNGGAYHGNRILSETLLELRRRPSLSTRRRSTAMSVRIGGPSINRREPHR